MPNKILLAILKTLFIYQIASSQTVCIWGRHDFNGAINGAYTQINTHNGKPYYRKSLASGCDVFLLYWDGNAWATSTTLGDEHLSSHAYCESSSTLTNCQNWYVWSGSSWVIDSAVSILSGTCPEIYCDAITISNAPNNCGSFTVYLGHNIWRNSDSTRWWFFSPYDFTWMCSDYAPYECDSLYWTWAEDGWTDLLKGQNMSIKLLYPSTQTRTLTCVGDPTPSPTNVPSNMPITRFPTKFPTLLPSLNPTNTPTNVPTLFPSLLPSMVPSMSPTKVPSVIPSENPTVTLTKRPSVIPPENPTLQPTFDDKHAEIVETAQATQYIKIKNENPGGKDSNDVFWIVISVLLVLIIICIVFIVFTIRRKLKKEQNATAVKVMYHSNINLHLRKDTNTQHIGEVIEKECTHTIPMKNDSIQDTNSNPISINDGNDTHMKEDSFIIEDDDEKYSRNTLGVQSNNVGVNNVFSSNIPMSLVSSVSPSNAFNALQNDNEEGKYLIEVKQWLTKSNMLIYYDDFVENGYDSLDIIKAVASKADLEEIGIVLKGHQQKLLVEIKKLNGLYNNVNIEYDEEIKDDDNTDEGIDTNEDITDPPTEEGDTPNDDGTGSSDADDNMNAINEKNTKGSLKQNLNDNIVGNDLLMEDVMDNINQTPQ